MKACIAARRVEELDRIIADEGLDSTVTHSIVDAAFRVDIMHSAGTAITKILPPVSRFSAGDANALKKRTVLEKFAAFHERFLGIGLLVVVPREGGSAIEISPASV